MIPIQHSQNSLNSKPNIQRSTDMTTELTQTLTLDFISDTNEAQQIKIEDLQKSLSSELPSLDIINQYSCLFTIQIQPIYLISQQSLEKSNICNEEQLGIGGNGQVFLCTDLSTQQLNAVKVVSGISFEHVNPLLYECINQYNLFKQSEELILNIVNLIQIRTVNQKVQFLIPLELAEFSLYEYIQNNEINDEIYQQLINILIDFLILLHTNNYAHRDIKPQNILYIKDVGWKLADFGESIKYEASEGMYKIKGTLAFIPQDVRKYSQSDSHILQDLFKNDVYATVCTLVMIKNPKFKSIDLQKYMYENKLDPPCSRLINITKLGELNQFIQEKLSKFQYLGKYINRIDELVFYDVKVIIILYSRLNKTLDNRIIQIIDTELGKFKDNNKLVDYNRVVIKLIQYFPFQTDKFKNIYGQFNHNIILRNPKQYFSNNIELCIFYFGRGLHKQLLEYQNNNFPTDSLDYMFIKLYCLILYGYLDQANFQLNLIANKIYSESSQVNSDFLAFYNQLYFVLHDEFPIIKGQNTQDIKQLQHLKELNSFQKKDLNGEDIQSYLNFKSFKPRGNINLLALLHPLQAKFTRFRNQKIFEHILCQIGCNSIQIQENKQLLSDLIKEHLQSNNSHQRDLQLIIQGCVVLYQYYDLLHELLDLLVYFQKILMITKPGIQSFELCFEIQRLIIKYNIDFDYKPQRLDKHIILDDNQFDNSDTIIMVIEIDIYNFQLKIIKQQFKQRLISKFKLTFTLELLTCLKLVQYLKNNNKKLIELKNLLCDCIFQSKPKYQQRFLQATIVMYQQSDSKERFIKHLNDLKQYKRVRNNFNLNQYQDYSQNQLLIFAGILLKNYNFAQSLMIYPTLKVQLFLACYNTHLKLFQNLNQHLNAFIICPKLKSKMPSHNLCLKYMYISKT